MSIFDYHIDHQPFGGTPNVNPEQGYSLSFRGGGKHSQHLKRANKKKEIVKPFTKNTRNFFKKIHQTLIFAYLCSWYCI